MLLGFRAFAYAEWEAPPGVRAILKANSDLDEIYFFPSTHWENSDLTFGSAPIENQDISGWILETQDGNRIELIHSLTNRTEVTCADVAVPEDGHSPRPPCGFMHTLTFCANARISSCHPPKFGQIACGLAKTGKVYQF